jgi:hypothetical protein
VRLDSLLDQALFDVHGAGRSTSFGRVHQRLRSARLSLHIRSGTGGGNCRGNFDRRWRPLHLRRAGRTTISC